MTVIQEAYVESVWEEAEAVRQRRDARYAELQASGLECHREDLYTVDLRRVFVVTAVPIERVSPSLSRQVGDGRSCSAEQRWEGVRLQDSSHPRSGGSRRSVRGYAER